LQDPKKGKAKMTEQFQQTNINQPMSGSRYVSQADIDTTLAIPAVVLNADDEFIIASDDDDVTPYTVNLPEVSEVPGKDITIQNRLVPVPSGVVVTVAVLAGSGQTINGDPSVDLLAAGDTIVLRADPPDNTVDPITQATNWTIVRGPCAPCPVGP
jgi:hypothetical protein